MGDKCSVRERQLVWVDVNVCSEGELGSDKERCVTLTVRQVVFKHVSLCCQSWDDILVISERRKQETLPKWLQWNAFSMKSEWTVKRRNCHSKCFRWVTCYHLSTRKDKRRLWEKKWGKFRRRSDSLLKNNHLRSHLKWAGIKFTDRWTCSDCWHRNAGRICFCLYIWLSLQTFNQGLLLK